MIYKIDTKVYANVVEPGTVVDTPDGTRIPVERVELGYNTVTLHPLTGAGVTLDYAEMVTVKGYYNR